MSQTWLAGWVTFMAAIATTTAIAAAGWAAHRAFSGAVRSQPIMSDTVGGRLEKGARNLGEGPDAFLPPIARSGDG